MSTGHYLYDLLRRWGLSDFAARTTEFLVARPLRVLLIVGIAWAIARLGSRAMDRFVRSLGRRAPARISTARSEQRTSTMASASGRFVRLITAVIAFLMILGVIGLNLGPLLAGSAVVGVALGLGAQNLVKDLLAGIFIVGEDQYGVGDIVDLGSATGVVEDVSLRSTRLRAADGTVWFVPNGQIQRVGNSSMEYSRALVDIVLPYGVELRRVEEVVADEADALAGDPEWSERLLDRPNLWGVQSLDENGSTVRLVVKTVPLQHGPVARELRRRIVDRLQRDGLRPPASPR